MKITKETVKYLSDLAMLNVSDAEADKISEEMEKMVAFVDKLSEIDTTGIEPTIFMTNQQNVFRDDQIQPSYDRDEMLKNAPEKQAGCYVVPKIVE